MRALTIDFLLIAATVACVAATFPVLDADRQAVIVFEQRLDCVPVGPVIRVGRLAPARFQLPARQYPVVAE